MRRVAATSFALGLALAGCGAKAPPYRFASPLLGGAELPDLPPVGSVRAAPAQPREAVAAVPMEVPMEVPTPTRPLPPRVQPPVLVRVPSDLRGLVGARDPRDPMAFAWQTAVSLAAMAPEARDQLLGRRSTLLAQRSRGEPGPGDLLFFARATADGGPVYAVAIAEDHRGVLEMIYLAAGVVRRGFVDPKRPTLNRDHEGRVVNTFLRHGRAEPPPGTRYLTGELYEGHLRLDQDAPSVRLDTL